jgi:hypothetical protein
MQKEDRTSRGGMGQKERMDPDPVLGTEKDLLALNAELLRKRVNPWSRLEDHSVDEAIPHDEDSDQGDEGEGDDPHRTHGARVAYPAGRGVPCLGSGLRDAVVLSCA